MFFIIYKVNNFGRLVIFFVNSYTEKILVYVDELLRFIVERLFFYIRDMIDFI